MNYKVMWRWWTAELKSRFGEVNSIHLLDDATVVALIIQFGRAEIKEEEGIRILYFQNDYD